MANETRDAKLWLSKLPETVYNTASVTGADYEALVSAETIPGILPPVVKSDDADRQGTGTEFATHLCNQYWSQPQIRIANDQDLFGIYGRMWLRAFGGAVVDSVVGTTGQKHAAELQHSSDGRQLPGTSMIYKNGVDDFLLSGMVAASASLGKQGAQPPSLAFDLVGTGKHASPHGVDTPPNYVAPTICADGGRFVVTYTKADATVVDLSALGCAFKALNVGINNNVKLDDRCPGDPTLTMNEGTAAYVTRVLRQRTRDRLVPAFTFLLNNLDVYKLMAKNETVTNVSIAIRGPAIAGGTAFYELGVTIPKAVFVGVQAVDVEGEQGYTAVLQPIYDSVIDNAAIGYVINETAANYK